MKTYKLYILGFSTLLGSLTTRARSSIDQVLRSIETNNKSLQANTKNDPCSKAGGPNRKVSCQPLGGMGTDVG